MASDTDINVNLPEKLGRKVTFGVYTIEDILRGGALLLVFVILAAVSGNIFVAMFLVFVGFVLFWLFGFVKIDGVNFHNYLMLKFGEGRKNPTLNVPYLKVYENGIVFNGEYWFKILSAETVVSLDFMSREDKEYVFSQFQQMLNSAPFPIQFIVHSWKVNPNAFDEYIKAEGKLAEGYRNLIKKHTQNLYLQSYYIVPLVSKYEVRSGNEMLSWKRANEILSVYVDHIKKSLFSIGIRVSEVNRTSEIFDVISEIMGGE